jgi:hypothetical protein
MVSLAKLLKIRQEIEKKYKNIGLEKFRSSHGPTVKKHLSRDYVGLIGFDER